MRGKLRRCYIERICILVGLSFGSRSFPISCIQDNNCFVLCTFQLYPIIIVNETSHSNCTKSKPVRLKCEELKITTTKCNWYALLLPQQLLVMKWDDGHQAFQYLVVGICWHRWAPSQLIGSAGVRRLGIVRLGGGGVSVLSVKYWKYCQCHHALWGSVCSSTWQLNVSLDWDCGFHNVEALSSDLEEGRSVYFYQVNVMLCEEAIAETA